MNILITDHEGSVLYEGSPPLHGNGVIIGSSSACDIQIHKIGIAREHVHLRTTAHGDLSIQDLQSPGGILVNGNRLGSGFLTTLRESCLIHLSDEIFVRVEFPVDGANLSSPSPDTTIFPFFLHRNEQHVQSSFQKIYEKLPRSFHPAIRAVHGELATRVRELSAFLEVSFALNSIFSFQRLLEFTIEMALAVTGAERGFIMLHNDERDRLETVVVRNVAPRDIERDLLASSGVVLQCFRTGKAFVGTSADAEFKEKAGKKPSEQGIQSIAVTPLRSRNVSIGVLYVDAKRSNHIFATRTNELLKVFAAQASVAIHRARLFHLATTDHLSGVANQKFFHQRLLEEFARSHRHKKPLSIILLDLDHFGDFNKKHGEPAGDHVLKSIGRIFRECMRVHDMVSRLGSDEFAMLLPETAGEGALVVAEKLRTLIEKKPFRIDRRSLHLTGSFGVATTQPRMAKPMDLVHAANKALNRARQQGGNRTNVAPTRDVSRRTATSTPP